VRVGHLGFAARERDFVINYDIKYRMGREESGESGNAGWVARPDEEGRSKATP